MTSRATRLRTGLVTGVLAAGLAATGAVVGAPAHGLPSAPATGPSAAAVDDIGACARPALSPSLKLDPDKVAGGSGQAAGKKVVRQSRLALAVATRGRELGVPARAQALAVTAALAGDVSPGRTLERFYRRLDAVPRWATLPPTIAVHRALGTPDPFAYEAGWSRAVTLLSTLSATRGSVASLVSTAGRAPSRCYVAASDAAALPLPPGSSYAIKAPRAARVADVTGPAVRKAAATELAAPCGTPVVAATSGTVEVVADEDAGPWLIKVRQPKTGVTTWYAHVQAPRVRTGESVLVGQQLAEVGDLGQVTSCSLGLTVSKRADGETRALDALPYLVGRGATVSDQPTTVPATSFRVASYNVLGHHLTARGGSKRGFGPGTTRVAGGIAKLEAQGVSIVVLNEFESPQAGVFLADGDWGLHRATFNNTFRDGNGNGNAVAWRADTWKMVGTDEFTVAWSTRLHMPVVTLQHLETAAQVTVIGVHNPASTSRQGNQSGARGSARATELAYIAALREQRPGVPVVFAGDMNERAEAFCGFTGGGLLQSSAGGSVGSPCRVPPHGPVDWIFGTLDLDFGGQYIDRSTLGRISDHPLLVADATIPEHELPPELVERGDPGA